MITASLLTVTPSRLPAVATPSAVPTAEAEPAAPAFSELLQRAGRPAEAQPTRSGPAQGSAAAAATAAAAAAAPDRALAAALVHATGPTARTPAARAAAEALAGDDANVPRASAEVGAIEHATPEGPDDPVPVPDAATPATTVAWAGDVPAGIGVPAAVPVDFRAAVVVAAPTGSAAPISAGDASAGVDRVGTPEALRTATAYDAGAPGPATGRSVPVAPSAADAAAPTRAFQRVAAQPDRATEPAPEAATSGKTGSPRTATTSADPEPAQPGTGSSAAATAAWVRRSATVDMQNSDAESHATDAVLGTHGLTDRAVGNESGGPAIRASADAPALTADAHRAGPDVAAPAPPASPNLVFTQDVRRGDPVATHRLDASPGSANFGAELGTQITTFVRDGLQHARLELNPAEMGPVTVQIRLDGQAAQVLLAADNADTRRALEQSMPQLATTLREAGLTLSGGGVFEQPRSPQQERAANPSRTAGHGPGAESGATASDSAGVAPVAVRRRGVVDLVA